MNKNPELNPEQEQALPSDLETDTSPLRAEVPADSKSRNLRLIIAVLLVIVFILGVVLVYYSVFFDTESKQVVENTSKVNESTQEVEDSDQFRDSDDFEEQEVSAPPIIIPESWHAIKFNWDSVSVTFMAPPEYEVNTPASEITISSSKEQDYWDYYHSNQYVSSDETYNSVLKNTYTGRSRREWFIDHKEKKLTGETPLVIYEVDIENVQEHILSEDKSYLEISYSQFGETRTAYVFYYNGLIHVFEQLGEQQDSSFGENMDEVVYSFSSTLSR